MCTVIKHRLEPKARTLELNVAKVSRDLTAKGSCVRYSLLMDTMKDIHRHNLTVISTNHFSGPCGATDLLCACLHLSVCLCESRQ